MRKQVSVSVAWKPHLSQSQSEVEAASFKSTQTDRETTADVTGPQLMWENFDLMWEKTGKNENLSAGQGSDRKAYYSC